MHIDNLEDKSATGIAKAADEGLIEEGNVRYSRLISEARNLVDLGNGDRVFAGFNLSSQEPIWKQPSRG